ncbi:MAG: hypothetical protein ACOYM2_22135, partial [Rectinemataceae bacterium]
MTTKQIAEAVNREVRAVQNWVKAMGAKNASIDAKNASSNSTHPADYDLAETCLIIEEGMGKDVADVYRTNAVNAELAAKPSRSSRLPAGAQIDAMIRLFGVDDARRRVDHVLGYSPRPIAPLLPEPLASDETAASAFASIRASLGDRSAR